MRKMIKEAFLAFVKDIKQNWAALAALACFFLIMNRVFHSLCPMVIFTGLPCPACGLTRAGLALLSGKFLTAWELHPFIYLVVLLGVYWGWQRYFIKKTFSVSKYIYVGSLIAMILFYIYRMIYFFPGDPPMNYQEQNLIMDVWHHII